MFSDLGSDWTNYNQIYDPKTKLTLKQSQRVIDFARIATTADDAEFAKRLGEFLDLDEFARFMAVTVYLSTLDSILGMGQNFLIHVDRKSNRFQFIPWDLDNSFGQFPMAGTQEEREQLSIQHPWQGENRFIERVFKVEAFQKRYRARLDEFSKTLFKPERFTNQVNEVAVAIRSTVKDEPSDRLTLFDKAVAGESIPRPGPGGNGGRGGLSPRGFSSEVKPIKAFAAVRAQSVADQLAGKSEGKIVVRGMGPRGRGGPGGRFDGPPWFERIERDPPPPGAPDFPP